MLACCIGRAFEIPCSILLLDVVSVHEGAIDGGLTAVEDDDGLAKFDWVEHVLTIEGELCLDG
jgi:hypothetical protein